MAQKKKAGTGVKTKSRTSVKDKALYKRLRNLVVSAKESARVANSTAKTSRKRTNGALPQPAKSCGWWLMLSVGAPAGA